MVGITGGIGSGKSTIANELRRRGWKVYDTDEEAKRLIVEDKGVRQQMTQLFGNEIYDGDTYRRDLVAAQVFEHPDKLRQLNTIVHPAVARDIERRKDVDFVESAILWESGLEKMCTQIVAVVAPEEIRLERAIKRDHSDEEKIRARMRNQMTDEERTRRCSHIVVNDGQRSIEELTTQLLNELYDTKC